MIQWTNIDNDLPLDGMEVIVEYDDCLGNFIKTIATYSKNQFIDKKTAKAIKYVIKWAYTQENQKVKIMNMINNTGEEKTTKLNETKNLILQRLFDHNVRLNSIISDNNEMIHHLLLNEEI